MSTSAPLSITEQMRVLQSDADIATWALEHLNLPPDWRDTNESGNTERCQEAVNRLFTLTRADIEASLTAQGLQPEDLPYVRTEVDSHDGSYFIAENSGWHFYYQERGYPWAGARFDDLAEARKLLLNSWIPAWLDHLRVPCRTKDGKVIKEL